MSYKHLAKAAALLSPLFLAGCIDSKYDLANIENDMRVEVKDLILPVNMDPIRLDDAIDFESGTDMIKTIKDPASGKEFYAFVQQGNFGTNEPIELARVEVDAAKIDEKHEEFNLFSGNRAGKAAREQGADVTATYEMKQVHSTFGYSSTALPKELSSVTAVGTTPFDLAITLKVNDPNDIMEKITFHDVTLALPKGLTTSQSSYNDGVWRVDNLVAANGQVDIKLTVTAIDLEKAGAYFNQAGELVFNGDFDITGGFVDVDLKAPSGGNVNPDPTISVDINYNVGSFEIASITGRVEYAEPFSIDPISLSGLPDFLADEPETVIGLSNPQLYMQVNNPVGTDGVSPLAKLALTALRGGNASPLTFAPANDIVLGTNHGDGPYSFVLAPKTAAADINIPTVAETSGVNYNLNLTGIYFPTLSNLLAPAKDSKESDMVGLPKQISVNLNLPPMDVTGFSILPSGNAEAKILPAITGSYYIVAPFGLTDNSMIVYKDRVDGWGEDSDDLDRLVITALSISADATNNTPVNLDVNIYPIDKAGNRIDGAHMGATIAANTTAPLDFNLAMGADGKVQGLDGIDIYAILRGHDGTPLSPDQTLVLNNLKVKVSGYYDAKFGDD